ncbi:DDE-type integrase/transposase/recombinase [Leptolyngbya sp. FACHB-671]|nr:DDE-type integrase/transposase/recombinase [Leptolyngbya sp. FACHB-671]
MEALKGDETTLAVSAKQRDQETELRQSKYLNNVIEQDHRNIKRLVKPMMGFKMFNSARRTLSGIEAMNMIRKGQVKEVKQGNPVSQAKFIESIFGIAA